MTGKISYKTIKRLMKIHTNRAITQEAIKDMIQNIELIIKEGTELAENLLHEENSFRKAQGLRENKRLSKRYITLAFNKMINREQKQEV